MSKENEKPLSAEEKQKCIDILKNILPYYGCIESGEIILEDSSFEGQIRCMQQYAAQQCAEKDKQITAIEASSKIAIDSLVKSLTDNDIVIKDLLDVVKAKGEEIENLKSVMMVAAEEIQEHWSAHCDNEGRGPASLMNRLTKGIGACYTGYKHGAIKEIYDKHEALKQKSDKLLDALKEICKDEKIGIRNLIIKNAHEMSAIAKEAITNYEKQE